MAVVHWIIVGYLAVLAELLVRQPANHKLEHACCLPVHRFNFWLLFLKKCQHFWLPSSVLAFISSCTLSLIRICVVKCDCTYLRATTYGLSIKSPCQGLNASLQFISTNLSVQVGRVTKKQYLPAVRPLEMWHQANT